MVDVFTGFIQMAVGGSSLIIELAVRIRDETGKTETSDGPKDA